MGARVPQRLALPMTVISKGDTAHLISGENLRYTLSAQDIGAWLPDLVEALKDGVSPDQIDALVGPGQGEAAREVLTHLEGERLLVPATPRSPGATAPTELIIHGDNPVGTLLKDKGETAGCSERTLQVLCQNRLDHQAAGRFNRERLTDGAPWVWATTGPQARAFVGPIFLPGQGPCLTCLTGAFRRLSPTPELYDALFEQAEAGEPIAASVFPPEGEAIVAQQILWKARLFTEAVWPPALFQLHVLEVSNLECTAHDVPLDPQCPDCRGERR